MFKLHNTIMAISRSKLWYFFVRTQVHWEVGIRKWEGKPLHHRNQQLGSQPCSTVWVHEVHRCRWAKYSLPWDLDSDPCKTVTHRLMSCKRCNPLHQSPSPCHRHANQSTGLGTVKCRLETRGHCQEQPEKRKKSDWQGGLSTYICGLKLVQNPFPEKGGSCA